jgi:hypothetical protein
MTKIKGNPNYKSANNLVQNIGPEDQAEKLRRVSLFGFLTNPPRHFDLLGEICL